MSPWPTTIYKLWQVLSSFDEDDDHDDYDGCGGGGGRLLSKSGKYYLPLPYYLIYPIYSSLIVYCGQLVVADQVQSSSLDPPQAGSVSSTNDSKLGFSRERSSLYNLKLLKCHQIYQVHSNLCST